MNKELIWNWTKKIAVLILGITIMSFGGVFCVKGQIGLSPLTALPYVLSLIFNISLGTCTTIFNIGLILLQIVLLRKNFKPYQFLQLFVAVLFGVTVDFATWCLEGIEASSYIQSWLCCCIGVVLIAIGISLEIISDSIPAPGDSTVNAISKVAGKSFGTVKTIFDCTIVVTSILLSLICLRKLDGIREATVFLALVTGILIKFFSSKMQFVKKLVTPKNTKTGGVQC